MHDTSWQWRKHLCPWGRLFLLGSVCSTCWGRICWGPYVVPAGVEREFCWGRNLPTFLMCFSAFKALRDQVDVPEQRSPPILSSWTGPEVIDLVVPESQWMRDSTFFFDLTTVLKTHCSLTEFWMQCQYFFSYVCIDLYNFSCQVFHLNKLPFVVS